MDCKKLTASAIALTLAFAMPSTAFSTDDYEAKIGAKVYADLKSKGEIISTSPYYSVLNPIAARIKKVADPQYDYPFHFILVHEKDPNAFAVPGGSVYVTDSLMKFVQNREELAGVLCHETSHDIHHDVVHNMKKNQRLGYAEMALGMIIGNVAGGLASTVLDSAAGIQSLTFSRQVETAADMKGADTCAEAGYNPWGLVWLFTHFEKSDSHGGMEILSDHPNNDHRINDLEAHFSANPSLFAHYSNDIHTAMPLDGNDEQWKFTSHPTHGLGTGSQAKTPPENMNSKSKPQSTSSTANTPSQKSRSTSTTSTSTSTPSTSQSTDGETPTTTDDNDVPRFP